MPVQARSRAMAARAAPGMAPAPLMSSHTGSAPGKTRSRCRHRPAASQRAQRKEGIDDD